MANPTKKLIDAIRRKIREKAKAEKEYASKQASVDTEIGKTATSTNTGGRSANQASVDTEIGKTATGGSPKDGLRIKRKNYSSMYKGSGRNIV